MIIFKCYLSLVFIFQFNQQFSNGSLSSILDIIFSNIFSNLILLFFVFTFFDFFSCGHNSIHSDIGITLLLHNPLIIILFGWFAFFYIFQHLKNNFFKIRFHIFIILLMILQFFSSIVLFFLLIFCFSFANTMIAYQGSLVWSFLYYFVTIWSVLCNRLCMLHISDNLLTHFTIHFFVIWSLKIVLLNIF